MKEHGLLAMVFPYQCAEKQILMKSYYVDHVYLIDWFTINASAFEGFFKGNLVKFDNQQLGSIFFNKCGTGSPKLIYETYVIDMN